MVNENIIGRMKCPFCGEENQDVKVNIRGNLYMICDNGCRFNFPVKATKTMKPALLSGRNINQNGILITSIKGGTNATGTGTNRNPTIGRTDGQLTGNQQSTGSQQPKRNAGGILGGFFADDDDE